ncbi:MAG: NAD-dependent epimerase/dehydratase family protein [Saprospiraceae bacterium]|nr:NAD-dependent epimerase/dehydratase family protein [Saprospiraceae bacterium]
MVVGTGMMAKRFSAFDQRDDVIIFASGVSNSKEKDTNAYDREINLLNNTISRMRTDQLFVYFSTTSIYDPSVNDSMYILHKHHVEHFIREQCRRFMIFRVSNVVGPGSNPRTVFSFFVNAIQNEIPFEVWQYSERNLIDIDDVYNLVCHFIGLKEVENAMLNLAYPSNVSVPEMVEAIAGSLKKLPKASFLSMGSAYKIEPLHEDLIAYFTLPAREYLQQLLCKYL